jgi:hypothetical protein
LKLHIETGISLASTTVKHAIIYQGGSLSLWIPEESGWKNVTRSTVQSDLYHRVKTLAHVQLSIWLAYQNNDQKMLDSIEEQLKKLSALMDNIPTSEQEVIIPLIRVYFNLLSDIKENKIINNEEIVKNLEKIKPAIGKLMQWGAKEEIRLIKQTMDHWIEKYGISLLDARVLLTCPHGPRRGLPAEQYFVSLYKNALNTDDTHAIEDVFVYTTEVLPSQYAESEGLEKKLIDELLIPSEVNKIIGKTFLKDKKSMFKDILHEDAKKVVESIVKKNIN